MGMIGNVPNDLNHEWIEIKDIINWGETYYLYKPFIHDSNEIYYCNKCNIHIRYFSDLSEANMNYCIFLLNDSGDFYRDYMILQKLTCNEVVIKKLLE